MEGAVKPTGRFQGRGMLLDGALYLTRDADRDLVDALAAGRHCHVLAPRQVGKSNLRVRATAALRNKGIRCASVDLTGIGSDVGEAEWYFGLTRFVARRFDLTVDVDAFWSKNERLSLPQRWIEFLRSEVAARAAQPTVLFFDEIDVTLGLRFSRDDFFRSIVFMQNARGDDPAWELITFCLMGVAAPTDLVQNLKLTPFNKSSPIQLDDFTLEELAPARAVLEEAGGDVGALLGAVFSWTHGHPALTQQLCEALVLDAAEGEGNEAERVRALVEEMYLRRGRTDDPILADVNNRFTGTDSSTLGTAKMLGPYKQVLEGEPTPAEGGNRVQMGLRISGLLAERRDDRGVWLLPRNKIFATVFDVEWVDEQLKARVYADPLTRWLQGGKKDGDVLVGERLEEALSWTRGRKDVTPEELEFLLAGQTAERKRQEEAEKRREDELARKRAESEARQSKILAYVFGGAFLGAIGSAAIIYWQYHSRVQERNAAVQLAQAANDEAQRAKGETARLLKEAKDRSDAMDREADDAQKKADELEKAYKEAKAKADEADQKAASDKKLAPFSKDVAKRVERSLADALDLDQKADVARVQLEEAKVAAADARSDAAKAHDQTDVAAAADSARAAHAQAAAGLAQKVAASDQKPEAAVNACQSYTNQLNNQLVEAEKSLTACTKTRDECTSGRAYKKCEADLKSARGLGDACGHDLHECTDTRADLQGKLSDCEKARKLCSTNVQMQGCIAQLADCQKKKN
jgi:AAA-like domain